MMSNCEEYRKRMPYQLLLKTQFSIAFSDFEAFWEWKQIFCEECQGKTENFEDGLQS